MKYIDVVQVAHFGWLVDFKSVVPLSPPIAMHSRLAVNDRFLPRAGRKTK